MHALLHALILLLRRGRTFRATANAPDQPFKGRTACLFREWMAMSNAHTLIADGRRAGTDVAARAPVVRVPTQKCAEPVAVDGPVGADVLAAPVDARTVLPGTRLVTHEAAGAAVEDVGGPCSGVVFHRSWTAPWRTAPPTPAAGLSDRLTAFADPYADPGRARRPPTALVVAGAAVVGVRQQVDALELAPGKPGRAELFRAAPCLAIRRR